MAVFGDRISLSAERRGERVSGGQLRAEMRSFWESGLESGQGCGWLGGPPQLFTAREPALLQSRGEPLTIRGMLLTGLTFPFLIQESLGNLMWLSCQCMGRLHRTLRTTCWVTRVRIGAG